MIGPRGLFVLYQGILATESVPGNVVEFGVWRGGSAALILQTLAMLGSSRSVHLFDSFAGIARPDETLDGESHREGEYRSEESDVRSYLSRFGAHSWQVYAGWISETFPRIGSSISPLSFVHIDVDLYASVKGALSMAYPQLSPGGIVLIDDYLNREFPGALRACLDFSSETGVRPLPLPTGQAIFIKGA